ncbi:MAG: dinitrogenase iron-molybdenum cofactor biosynthesis protein [Candidatus Thiodiazotropha sp.]|jgi:nitrogen fixation protein NifX
MNIDRDTALRIALAARTLPDVDLTTLIGILDERLGSPLDLEKLSRITVTDLKTGIGSLDGEEDGEDFGGRSGLEPIKLAVRVLWGETTEDDNLPIPDAYEEGDMPGSIRVALASNSLTNLDGHFGSCLRYLVYQVSADEARLIGVRSALEADFAEDRNAFRVELIKDCHLLYIVSVGGPAAAKIIRADIYPMKKIEGGEATEVLTELQGMMSGVRPPWLAKILGVPNAERFRYYSGEEVD